MPSPQNPSRSELFREVAAAQPFVLPDPKLKSLSVAEVNLTIELATKEELHVDACSERVLVTHLLKRGDPRHGCQRAPDARANEIEGMEKHRWVLDSKKL